MHKSRSLFGKAFEEKGDFRKAAEAYRSAGLEDDAARARSKLRAVETAGKLEAHGLYVRAVDVLLDGGLAKEAGEFAQRVEKADTPESSYVQIKVLSLSGYSERMERPFRRLRAFGPYGQYLFGMAMAESMPQIARRVADGLSGVSTVEDREDSKGPRVFVCGNDPDAIAEQMSAMTFWATEDTRETGYFAMRIYQKLGLSSDAGRCLADLRDDEWRFRFFDILRKGGGIREIVEAGIELDNERRIIYALVSGHADKALKALDCFENTEEEKFDYAGSLLRRLERHASDLLDAEAAMALIGYREGKRETLARSEREALERAGELLRGGSLPGIEEAKGLIGQVRFKFTKGNYWVEMSKCAHAAREIGSVEALVFAGDIYRNCDLQKAMECAESLLDMGERGPAKKLFAGIASGVHYSIYSQSRHGEPDQGTLSIKDLLLERALHLEPVHPAISLAIYRGLYDEEGIVRTARAMLAGGSEEDIEQAAWAVSISSKKSLLMRDLLLKLEGYGDEGSRKAEGIRREMTVPKLFEAK